MEILYITMVKGSYTLQSLKKLLIVTSTIFTLNSTGIAQTNIELDTTISDTIQPQIIKHKEYAIAKEGLDLAKEAGFDIRESDYNKLESFVKNLRNYISRGGIAKEFEKKQELDNLENVLLEFKMNHYIYKNDQNTLIHKTLRDNELSPFTAMALYLEVAKAYKLSWIPAKAGEHLFLKTEYGNWDPILGIEQSDKDYEKLMAKGEEIIYLDKEDLILIEKRNLGFALNKKGEYDKAIKYLDEVIEMNPFDYWALKYRGDSYDAKGDYKSAAYDYEEAINHNSLFKEAYISLGDVSFKRNRNEKAAENYGKAIKLDPEDASIYKKRGDTYRRNDESKAQKDYLKAQELMFLQKK